MIRCSQTQRFIYKIGDFSLDEFSFNFEKSGENENFNLYAFKRSFTGFDNQYYNSSLQPIQQSYISSISSRKENSSIKINLGHFNTFSNFPDGIFKSNYRQIITTINFHFQHDYRKFNFILSLDNFLQKLRSNHSLSITTKNRYLSRSLLQGKIIFPNIYGWGNTLSFLQNKRSVKSENISLQNWNSILVNTNHKNFDFYLEYGSMNKKLLLSYGLNVYKEIPGLLFKISFSENSKPFHPYYHFVNDVTKNQLVEKNKSKIFTLDYSRGKSLFHLRFSLINGLNPFWNDNEESRTIFMKINNRISSNLNFSLFYNYEGSITYMTGGLDDWYGMDISYRVYLFKNNMSINFTTNLKNYISRNSNVYFNPIEMVPINSISYDVIGEMSIVNFGIRMNISTFTFEYNWINLLELLNKSEELNKVTFNPKMPYNGWQKQISIVWHFLN